MSYYAPFYQTPTNYIPNGQSGFAGQNNGFYGYSNQQGNLPQQNITQNIAQNQQSDGMIWVLGRNEAESYPVAPNCQVILWDKDAPTLYVKSMSANNVPNLRVLDFVERTENAKKHGLNADDVSFGKFVAVEDFEDLRADFLALKDRCDRLERVRDEKSEEKENTKTKNSAQKGKEVEK